MDGLMKGWYSEVGSLWPGQAMSLKARTPAAAACAACAVAPTTPPWRASRVQVKAVLHQAKSDFQDVLARAGSACSPRCAGLGVLTPHACERRRCLTRRRTAACSCSTAAYS
jgi:hypothetical protein